MESSNKSKSGNFSRNANAFILISSFLVFFPSLNGDFVFDDLPAIVKNPDLSDHSKLFDVLSNVFRHDFWGENLTSSHSHKSLRPLTTLTFWIQGKISRQNVFQFHFVNVLLHTVNCFLAFKIYREFFSVGKAFWATLVFTLHPVHVESVAAIVGRADILYTFFVLAGILVTIKTPPSKFVPQIVLVSLLCNVSVLFKELGIVLIPLAVVLEIILKHKVQFFPVPKSFNFFSLVFKVMLSGILFCLIIWFRMYLIDFTPPTFQRGDNPFAFIENPALKFANLSYVYFVHFWILLDPNWLCFDWAFHCIKPIETFSDIRLLLVILFYAFVSSIGLISMKRNDSKILIFLAFLIIPFIPSSNVIFTVGFVVAERNLYLNVFGQAAILVAGFKRLEKKISSKDRGKLKLSFVATMILFAAKALIRSYDWRTESSLYSSGLKVCPNNAKVYYNIAKLSADASTKASNRTDKQYQILKSIAHYEKALQLWPDYEQALNNLGNLYRQQGDNLQAKKLLKRALSIQPKFPACWMNLGVAQANLNEFEEAELSYKTALEQRKNYPDCHYNLGTLYLKMRSFDQAIGEFSTAIRLRPDHFSAWSNLVILFDNLERYREAEVKAKAAIGIFPEKSDFYFHLANVFGKQDLFPEAESMYAKAIERDPVKAIHFVNLGVLYHRWKKLEKAEEAYMKALVIDPYNGSAKANLKRLSKG